VNAEHLILELQRLDVKLSTRGGRLICDAPQGALSDEVRQQIKQLKPDLLAMLVSRPSLTQPPLPSQAVASHEGSPPLSRSQARIRDLAILQPEASVASNIPLGFKLRGPLDPDALERAIEELVQRHEALRSSCDPRGPSLVVHPEAKVPLSRHDLRHEPERSAALDRLTRPLVEAPFDLEAAPILRAMLVRIMDDEWVLVLVTHVFAFDGRSTPLLLADLSEGYAAALAGQELGTRSRPPRYSNFARQQHRQLDPTTLTRQREWWTATLAGTSTLTHLDDSARPERYRPKRSCGHVAVNMPDFLVRSITGLARSSGATLFHTLFTAWILLLQRHTGRPSLAVGTIVSNRQGVEAERTIGSFANNILLRADFVPGTSFGELLGAVRDRARSALANLDIPFESLLPRLEPSLYRSPPFRIMFMLHQSTPSDGVELRLVGVQATAHPTHKHHSHYLLDLVLTEVEGEIQGHLAYDDRQLSEETAEALIQRYLVLLKTVCADPSRSFDALPSYRIESPPSAAARPPSPPPLSPPFDDAERAIHGIWSTLLGVDTIGRDENFFDLGGHSLLALAMLAEVEQKCGPLGPKARRLFAQRPTLSTLARLPSNTTSSPRSDSQ